MAIDLDVLRIDESAGLGNVTNESTFSGDVTGTRDTGLTVTGLHGVVLDNTNALQANQGYMRLTGPNLVPVTIVYQTLPTTAGGVKGDFDAGLNVRGIYNSILPATGQAFTEGGQALVYDANEEFLVPTQINPRRRIAIGGATPLQALDGDDILVNAVNNAITINAPTPATLANGSTFEVSFLKSNAGVTNHVTINAIQDGGVTSFVMNKLSVVRLTSLSGVWIVMSIGQVPTP